VTWAEQHESGAGTERWAKPVSAALGRGDHSAARFGTAVRSLTWIAGTGADSDEQRPVKRAAAVARAMRHRGGPDRKRAWLAPPSFGHG